MYAKEDLHMRYYSTQRPLEPGCCPRAGVQDVHNFDKKTFCKEIGREAWGYIDYNRELTPEEVEDYELTLGGLKTFWCVTSYFGNNGNIVSNITDVIKTALKPENKFMETKTKDIYVEWFESEEEANHHVRDARNA